VPRLASHEAALRARKRFEEHYAPDVVYRQLLDVYADVIARRQGAADYVHPSTTPTTR
jgi:hypothetical protein